MIEPSEHLHMVREDPPNSQPGYFINKVFCAACQKAVFIIHVELPRDPKK